ncbi:MAG: anhydro-N-acetylmuramic acid kinase [Bacteroidota bacterium]|nr:anhydro-N-acetylmuramic acid kinase [Bacteroidota bacterium]
MSKSYNVIGLMSGTSLDGLDLAFCKFEKINQKWQYEIECAETISYNNKWENRLRKLPDSSGIDIIKTHVDYGHYIGSKTLDFINRNNLSPDFISSHGHTVFHQPENNFTFQCGSGAAISAETLLPVVCDFRSMDVALGGQGAPLVPIGDELLFNDFDFCLNLGGFANISYNNKKKRIAFDVCPVNIVLNHLAELLGMKFDPKGDYARKGSINTELLENLNNLSFYNLIKPKSLGFEWVKACFLPLIYNSEINIEDKLRTVTEHIAIQISRIINNHTGKKALITGGGVHNSFLIECIASKTSTQLIIPDKLMIDYKEALIFAFLGVLRMCKSFNTLKSVTGANIDSVGGAVYYPNPEN